MTIRDLAAVAALSFATACGGAAPSPKPPVTVPVDAATTTTEPTPEAPAKPAFIAGPSGFPLPADATEDNRPGLSPPGIKTFAVPRGRDLVAEEVRGLLAADGWTLDSSETSGRGSIRMVASKAGTTIKASVAGDETKAAVIVTLPVAP